MQVLWSLFCQHKFGILGDPLNASCNPSDFFAHRVIQVVSLTDTLPCTIDTYAGVISFTRILQTTHQSYTL